MLGIEGKTVRAAWTVAVVAGGLVVLYLVRRTLLIFVCALLLAYLLAPLVAFIDRFGAERVSRNFALAIVYGILIAAVAVTMTIVGGRVADDAANLAQTLPKYLRDPQFPLPWWLEPYHEWLLAWWHEQLEPGAEQIVPMLKQAWQRVVAVLGNLIFVVVVPVISFFFLKDSDKIRAAILNQLHGPQRRMAEDIFADIHLMLAQYMRALVVLSLITFLCYWVFFAIIGAPYAASLALTAGVLEFIPAAGPFIAAVAILTVTSFAGYPHLLWIIIFLILYRLFLDYVLLPHVMSAGAELPPVAVILGILAGEQIGGVMGMFLSIPVLATLRVIYVRYRKSRQQVE